MTDGAAADFVALVPPSATEPRCEELPDPPPMLGARVLSFVYGGYADMERRVTVILDGEGKPTGYSDLRGDLLSSDAHEGDVTTVSLDLARRQAFASNRPADGEAASMRIPFDEALVAPELDRPGERIAAVLATCSGGR